MTRNSPAPRSTFRTRSTAQHLATVAVAVGMLIHMFFTFVYNVPTASLRSALPTEAAARYMEPLFVQDYKIFAPEPATADHQLWVRAWLEDGTGEPETTEWINVSSVELSVRYRQVLRKHMSIIGAERLMAAHTRLSPAQKELAAQNYHRDGLDRLHRDLLDAEPNGDPAVAATFIRSTRFLDAFATQVAFARGATPENLAAVQTRVVYDPVVPWKHRNDPDAPQPAARITDTGWRRPLEYPNQDREAFASTFRGWMGE